MSWLNKENHNFKLLRHARNTIIEIFQRDKVSRHSSQSATLRVILEYCEDYKIPYRLTAHPGVGYTVEQIAPMEAEEKNVVDY